MNLSQLRYITEVQKTGSITRAAQNLYMGQPNMSKAIKELEGEIGIRLFRRTAKGVEPTEAGQLFLRRAAKILEQVDALQQLYGADRAAPLLRLSSPDGESLLSIAAPLCAQLENDHGFSLMIKEQTAEETFHALSCEELDAGIIRINAEQEPQLTRLVKKHELAAYPFREYQPLPVLRAENAPSKSPFITAARLKQMIELSGRADALFSPGEALSNRRITAQGFLSRIELLCALPNAFMLNAPLPNAFLRKRSLIQLPAPELHGKTKEFVLSKKGAPSKAAEQLLPLLEAALNMQDY